MKLDKKEVKKIADLARLELTDKELETYGSQMSDILGYVDQLQEVDVTDIQPTAQVTGLENAQIRVKSEETKQKLLQVMEKIQEKKK